MILDQMTWPEIDALDRERTLVLGCVAATEQHSHHLPLATDSLIGTAILQRVSDRLGNKVLVLPTVWLGISPHHLEFAGSLSTRWDHFIATITDISESMLHHRFRKMLWMNSHGGNQAALGVAVQQLADTHPTATVVGATYWTVASSELNALRESAPGGMGHACELETSIVLAVAPHLVHMDRAEPDGSQPGSAFSQGEMLIPPKVVAPKPFSKFTHHGGFGDPTLATGTKGEKFLNAIAGRVAALCEDILGNRV
jgi:creatinine amidohydrolase